MHVVQSCDVEIDTLIKTQSDSHATAKEAFEKTDNP